MGVILRLKKFSFTYPEVKTPVLQDLDLEIEAGRCYCLTGPTGSGKTTLALALKGLLCAGKHEGEIYMPSVTDSTPMAVGMVLQDPEVQLLTSSVGAEVAFGLENLCVDPADMPERVVSALQAVGLEKPLDYPVDKLSMGQKYRLLIAALLVMKPLLLILDEPGAQLDPEGLELLRECLRRLKQDGVSIILCEHRPDSLLSEIDTFLQLDGSGRLAEGRYQGEKFAPSSPPFSAITEKETVLRVQDLSFIGVGDQPVWSQVAFTVDRGRRFSVTGMNGTGKTTLLRCLAGFLSPQQGEIEILGGAPDAYRLRGRLGCLFQNPQKQIFENTVGEEIAFPLKRFGLLNGTVEERVAEALAACGISHLIEQSPHKLSYGQKHLVALASVLAPRPELLLLDDPLAGLDDDHSRAVMELLVHYNVQHGTTMLWTFHDPDAWPGWADQVLHLEGGRLAPR
ncbi:MAG: energy-coupling factor ABC transporter ATP-binding protein [Desulfuromonadaceae bacterium]|nr:energy-coupling factor ABC transporter ATP-binding protein [Desulfuromonadaceae bacterium]